MLTSILFKNNERLQACALSHSAHVVPGSRGEHVARIQKALNLLQKANLDQDGDYGPRTTAAVLAYKRERSIINASYQNSADNIVGIMTIQRMDKELKELPRLPMSNGPQRCTRLV